jgi:hypothetical protein
VRREIGFVRRVLRWRGFAQLAPWAAALALMGRSLADAGGVSLVSIVVPLTCFAVLLVLRGGLGFRRVLAAPDAEAAIRRADRPATWQRYGDVEAMAVREAAHLLALYGDLDAARAELATVAWADRPPRVHALAKVTEALIELLSGGDAGRARNLVLRAQQMAARTEARLKEEDQLELMAVVGACDLFKDPRDAVSLEQLRLRAKSTRARARLIAHWALGVHAWGEEERAEAEAHFAVCRRLAPHCPLLHRAPALAGGSRPGRLAP